MMKFRFVVESAREDERISTTQAQQLLKWIYENSTAKGIWALIPTAYEKIRSGMPVNDAISQLEDHLKLR